MDIKINDTESNIIYTFRKNFIEEYKKNNTDEDMNTIIKYSKILANIKFKGCNYDGNKIEELKSYL
jgi:hypothetical protein